MRTHYKNGDEISLPAGGCDGCSGWVIQGLYCHEIGCPDVWRDTPKACWECGCNFMPNERMQSVCCDCQEEKG